MENLTQAQEEAAQTMADAIKEISEAFKIDETKLAENIEDHIQWAIDGKTEVNDEDSQ
jgi:hypothetical protein